jgi:hypothetical protein
MKVPGSRKSILFAMLLNAFSKCKFDHSSKTVLFGILEQLNKEN